MVSEEHTHEQLHLRHGHATPRHTKAITTTGVTNCIICTPMGRPSTPSKKSKCPTHKRTNHENRRKQKSSYLMALLVVFALAPADHEFLQRLLVPLHTVKIRSKSKQQRENLDWEHQEETSPRERGIGIIQLSNDPGHAYSTRVPRVQCPKTEIDTTRHTHAHTEQRQGRHISRSRVKASPCGREPLSGSCGGARQQE